MSRPWMYGDHTTTQYLSGVEEFIRCALSHQRSTKAEKIYCPCRDCKNIRRLDDIDEIEDHLFRRGFKEDYHVWFWHGEKIPDRPSTSVNEFDVRVDTDDSDDDIAENNEMDDDQEDDEINGMMDGVRDHLNEQPQMFEQVSKAAETPLYPGCTKFSKLEAVSILYNLKCASGWTDGSFNTLLEWLGEFLPEGNEMPISTYYARKLMCPLGLDVVKIDACPNDCMLYRNEHENSDECPKCGASRYKRKGINSAKRGPAAKVMWYLPIIPRFQRLFSIKKEAKNLRWHAEGRKKDGQLRHPADSPQWRNIDKKYSEFGDEVRNLRLALCTDGVSPYGPKQPGNDIDVYLAPLVDDLKLLWNEGVPMFDAYTNSNFTLRAMVFCTINDFPAYGNLSGYKTKGEQACPVCEEDMKPAYLSNYRKNVYLDYRKFLSRYHPYRKKKKEFNGYTEEGVARTALTGSQVYERIKNVDTKYGKCFKSKSKKGVLWKKVSILWDLPYWKDLSVRHCLDVMHIEKNVCDAIIGTLLNIPGKTKDNQNVRFDMKERNIRPDLWPVVKPDGKRTFLPPACYTMSRKEKKVFCECLHGIKVPSGYSSNVKRLVSLPDLRLIGMKSHDCHVLLNVFLPIALRGILPKHVRHVITKLCVFFSSICAKVIDPEKLDALHVDIVETLCRFEMYFPPSFFDIMVHLIVHLVREIKLCGPVYLRWMYPFERFFGGLKDKVKNRANPEGSIIRGVLHEEISQYAAEFLSRLHPIGLPKSRHTGRLEGEGVIGKKVISPPSERKSKAHLCVLQHLTEVNPYIEKHKWLSRGPRLCVRSYEGYDINGFTFYTRRQDEKSVVQNSGVKVIASSRVYASAKDKRPVDATQSYYGVIEEIWELDYNNFTIPVFRCKWVNNPNGVKQDEIYPGLTLVNFDRLSDSDEPFILASQAKQIFYVVDNVDPRWRAVVQGKRHILGIDDVVDEDEYDEYDDTPLLSTVVQPLPEEEDINNTNHIRTDHREGIWEFLRGMADERAMGTIFYIDISIIGLNLIVLTIQRAEAGILTPDSKTYATSASEGTCRGGLKANRLNKLAPLEAGLVRPASKGTC
ncbi:uncharacterized protein [Phyllobates terribilis]|uniref:uncharacterized protein n=1 Tax=Phyllobates terribilis TaxID=111132 RepID=UPI003CCABB78